MAKGTILDKVIQLLLPYIHLTAFFQDNLGRPAPER